MKALSFSTEVGTFQGTKGGRKLIMNKFFPVLVWLITQQPAATKNTYNSLKMTFRKVAHKGREKTS